MNPFGDNLNASINKDKIHFNAEQIIEKVNSWIRELETYRDAENESFNKLDDPTYNEKLNHSNMNYQIDSIIGSYNGLIVRIEDIEVDFANAARAFRSPLKQGLNDIYLLYNEIQQIGGDFKGFKDVSIYIHGIESYGEDFLESAVKAARIGDVIVREN